MRLNLARALFAPADLLLLDEPTNHLDLDAVLWLERWLVRSACTMVIVSHDRDFLDRVVKCCLHIDEGRLMRFAGGYSDFERQRAARAAQAARERESSAARAAHLESFIRRFRAQATRARQVQSRIKALERMAEVEVVRALNGVDIELASAEDCPEHLVLVERLGAGYHQSPVVQVRQLQIERGARIGVLGRNGAGKTTLIRTLVGELPPVSGEITIARGLRVGYFAQQGVDALRDDESALRHLQRLAPDQREQALRDFMGRFGFRGDDATRPVGPMSGGEKARLLFALLAWQRPQLLVLDEPTNHLDAQTRDSLADALARFDGALLLVSHDRYLLRASVDRFVIVADGTLTDYDGDLDDYDAWIAQRRGDAATAAGPLSSGDSTERLAAASPPDAAAAVDRRTERRRAAERRTALATLTRAIDADIRAIETRLRTLESELGHADAALQDPTLYGPGSDGGKVAGLNRQRAALAREKDEAETRWLELQTQRDEQVSAFDAA
jgi:ATP-binding cassette subfamily F protein 3